jgi:hypothetical protein
MKLRESDFSIIFYALDICESDFSSLNSDGKIEKAHIKTIKEIDRARNRLFQIKNSYTLPIRKRNGLK